MSSTPSLLEVLRAVVEARLADVRVSMPARVVSYDATRQAVSVKPIIRQGRIDSTGERVADSLPVIENVPVVFPGAGGFRVTFPVAAGDTVLLVFSEQSLDKWLALGGRDTDPLDDRRHDLTDAVAVPGLRSFADALDSAPTDSMSIGKDGGPTIEITDSEIKAGGTERLVTKAEFDAHFHSDPVSGVTSTPNNSPITGTDKLRG